MATSANRDSHPQQQASATRFSDSEATSFWPIRAKHDPHENANHGSFAFILPYFAHVLTHILLAPKKIAPAFWAAPRSFRTRSYRTRNLSLYLKHMPEKKRISWSNGWKNQNWDNTIIKQKSGSTWGIIKQTRDSNQPQRKTDLTKIGI
jgi:hypothetical protein